MSFNVTVRQVSYGIARFDTEEEALAFIEDPGADTCGDWEDYVEWQSADETFTPMFPVTPNDN